MGSEWKALGELPDGPLDIIGDVHGEIDALTALLEHLGYQRDGSHRKGRRMVFVGDLIDRGPDSPGVVRLVADFVRAGRALAVMGNHDLNAIAGKLKKENAWLFGHGPADHGENPVSSESERAEILRFSGNTAARA